MKKHMILLIACVLVVSFLSGCNSAGNAHKSPVEYDEPVDNDIHVSPVTTERFGSLEEFISSASGAKGGDSVAKLDTLQTFYVSDAIPNGYSLYKIGAGTADIGFFYLPDDYTHSQELIWQGESELRHFLFISSRGIYAFDSVLGQHGASIEDLIDGKYLVVEKGPRDIIIWEQDGEVLMLYIPAELNYTDVLPYCTASKYVRNEETQTFELEKWPQ